MSRKTALIILDGFGITPEKRGNAVLMAKTPYFDELISGYPKTLLKAGSYEVGLPWGEAGNSEVGHTNIGLGRVVLQDLPQIDLCFEKHEFSKKESVLRAKSIISKNKSNLHLIGMMSDGAVHGHIRHLEALIAEFKNCPGIKQIILHLIADGRDVPEKSAKRYAGEIQKLITENISVGSLSGRFFAMDRDKNWDRIETAYKGILGESKYESETLDDAIDKAYERDETDEFISPTKISGLSFDLKNDVIIFTNYRSDRALQLTRAFVDPNFNEFERKNISENFFAMTTYDDNLGAQVFFSNLDLNDKSANPLTNPLGKILSSSQLTQHHVAETEKYAHVTYFLSGGQKEDFAGQTNKLIPSEKVKSYDLFPQMRAMEIAEEIVAASKRSVDFIICNFANGDMVGHSGNLEKTIEAVQILDQTLKTSLPELINAGYSIFLTADHGNCDQMIDLKSGKPDKEHSHNPVPLIYISGELKGSYQKKDEFFSSGPTGVLADIAPTILKTMEIGASPEMTGADLSKSML